MNKVLCILVLLVVRSAVGLRCYVCTMSASETSDVCVTNPSGVTSGAASIECKQKYCTVKRQEYKNPAGRVASFYRGCENNPIHLNTMVEDEDFKTYFRACTSDLCNIGNGVQAVSNGNLGAGGTGVSNLLVPGLGNSALTRSASSVLLAAVLLPIAAYFAASA